MNKASLPSWWGQATVSEHVHAPGKNFTCCNFDPAPNILMYVSWCNKTRVKLMWNMKISVHDGWLHITSICVQGHEPRQQIFAVLISISKICYQLLIFLLHTVGLQIKAWCDCQVLRSTKARISHCSKLMPLIKHFTRLEGTAASQEIIGLACSLMNYA